MTDDQWTMPATFESETRTGKTAQEALLAPIIQAFCDRNFSTGKAKITGCSWPNCFCEYAKRAGERVVEALENNGWRKPE